MKKELLKKIIEKKIKKLNSQLLQILKIAKVLFMKKIKQYIKILKNIKKKLTLNLIKKIMA